MITKFEENILIWIQNNILKIMLLVVTILSIVIRFSMRNFYSIDADVYLLPWYNALKTNGGLLGLGTVIDNCNYSFPYMLLVALMTYMPIPALFAYKVVSCVFDYLLAYCVKELVRELLPANELAMAFAYTAVVMSPLVFLNSSAWAQCDSIYGFFCLLSILYLVKDRFPASIVALGFSFAFKMQAIMFLPFFLFFYVYKKKYSILWFALLPLPMLILSLPALLQGRTVADIVMIYSDNTGAHPSIADNYPSFWRIMNDGTNTDSYETFKVAAILFTICILGVMITYFVKHRIILTPKNIVFVAFSLNFTAVYFLPSMHERYGYVYEILSIVICCVLPKTIPLAVGQLATILTMYGVFLYKQPFSESLMAWIYLLIYTAYMVIMFRQLAKDDIDDMEKSNGINSEIKK